MTLWHNNYYDNDTLNMQYPYLQGLKDEKLRLYYTRRQINLYRMFFADFSVNSQPIFMKFCKEYFRVTRRLLWNFHRKI